MAGKPNRTATAIRKPGLRAILTKPGQIVYTGPATPPEPNERGFKDTVAAPGGQITRVMMRFSPYAGDYVWHCHILEHESYGVMSRVKNK